MYKRKHAERFDAWWGPLTRQGDPSHRYDLVGEAFDAGYEAGKAAALLTLGTKLVEQYSAVETALEYECNNDGCNWKGPRSELLHPKHSPEILVCPQCTETVGPV